MNQPALTTTNPCPRDLKQVWDDYRQKNPQACPRKAAKALKVSEAELVATGCGVNVTRLAPKWLYLFQSLGLLGTVKAQTRNDHAVHENIGLYRLARFSENKCLVWGDNIDLNLSLSHWHSGFAVEEANRVDPGRYSFQFFDFDGTSVHKVYLTQDSYLHSYHSLVSAFKGPDQSPDQCVQTSLWQTKCLEDQINIYRLREHWRKLKSSSGLPLILDEFGINRFQALRLAGNEFVSRVPPDLFHGIMQTIADIQLPVRVFVGNIGVTQIHNGPIQNLRKTGPWLNVLDDEFSLHVNEEAIASLWVVNWPTAVGTVTSLEFYDAQGTNIALVFGPSWQEDGENPVWRDLIGSLPIVETAA